MTRAPADGCVLGAGQGGRLRLWWTGRLAGWPGRTLRTRHGAGGGEVPFDGTRQHAGDHLLAAAGGGDRALERVSGE